MLDCQKVISPGTLFKTLNLNLYVILKTSETICKYQPDRYSLVGTGPIYKHYLTELLTLSVSGKIENCTLSMRECSSSSFFSFRTQAESLLNAQDVYITFKNTINLTTNQDVVRIITFENLIND